MKKRNTAIRALSVFLAYAMVCTSVPAAGQEMFGSGVNRETEENTSDLKEFQSSQADEFGTDTGSDAELFGSDDAKQEFQDGENSEVANSLAGCILIPREIIIRISGLPQVIILNHQESLQAV